MLFETQNKSKVSESEVILAYMPLFSFLLFLTLFSCKSENQQTTSLQSKPVSTVTDKVQINESQKAETEKDTTPIHLQYAFKKTVASQNLNDLIKVPTAYTRVKVSKNSFGEWLRFLPAKAKKEKVKLYNGNLKSNQKAHYAILDIDVGKRDLQQCADAVMRLRAEYCYAQNDFTKIHFNFTSGHKVAFEDWCIGKKPKVSGNSVTFSSPGSTRDTSYPNFRKYMNMIFNYAGTASLSKELQKVDIKNMKIGDVFIQGGFPGHAVIVMDMAENEAGQKIFLIAQSYMPAQDIHILKNYEDENLSPWYSLDFDNTLNTPEWRFYSSDLMRF